MPELIPFVKFYSCTLKCPGKKKQSTLGINISSDVESTTINKIFQCLITLPVQKKKKKKPPPFPSQTKCPETISVYVVHLFGFNFGTTGLLQSPVKQNFSLKWLFPMLQVTGYRLCPLKREVALGLISGLKQYNFYMLHILQYLFSKASINFMVLCSTHSHFAVAP